jgi:hypothetical protein
MTMDEEENTQGQGNIPMTMDTSASMMRGKIEVIRSSEHQRICATEKEDGKGQSSLAFTPSD